MDTDAANLSTASKRLIERHVKKHENLATE